MDTLFVGIRAQGLEILKCLCKVKLWLSPSAKSKNVPFKSKLHMHCEGSSAKETVLCLSVSSQVQFTGIPRVFWGKVVRLGVTRLVLIAENSRPGTDKSTFTM